MVLLHDFTLETQFGIQFWLIILSQVINSPHKLVQASLNAVRVVPLPCIVFFSWFEDERYQRNSTSRIETTFVCYKNNKPSTLQALDPIADLFLVRLSTESFC